MRTIWKFPLEITDQLLIEMPDQAQLLAVQVQGKGPTGQELVMLWALVDPSLTRVQRVIAIHGTGHKISDFATLAHIGSIQLSDGRLVFHVFDRGVAT